MRPIATFLLSCAAACGVATPAAANHLGAERQIDRHSETVRRILDAPLPPNWDEIRVLAGVMAIAHYPEAAEALVSLVEREALLDLLGEAAPARPAKAEHVVVQQGGETRKSLRALRERVLAKPVAVAVLQEHDPSLAPKIPGFSFRHAGGSVWTPDDRGTQRHLGVVIANRGGHEILRGQLELDLGKPGKPQRFACLYGFPLAPGESKAMSCPGDASRPLDELMRAIRDAAQAPPSVHHSQVVYRLRGIRFQVGGADNGFGGDRDDLDARAMAMVRSRPCGARNACGTAVKEGLTGSPMLGGFLLGIVTGAIVLLVMWVGGRRAAGRAASGIVLALFALSVVGIIAAAMIGLQGHVLYAFLFAGVAAGYAGEMGLAFLFGLGGVVFAWQVARSLRRRLRAA